MPADPAAVARLRMAAMGPLPAPLASLDRHALATVALTAAVGLDLQGESIEEMVGATFDKHTMLNCS